MAYGQKGQKSSEEKCPDITDAHRINVWACMLCIVAYPQDSETCCDCHRLVDIVTLVTSACFVNSIISHLFHDFRFCWFLRVSFVHGY